MIVERAVPVLHVRELQELLVGDVFEVVDDDDIPTGVVAMVVGSHPSSDLELKSRHKSSFSIPCLGIINPRATTAFFGYVSLYRPDVRVVDRRFKLVELHTQ